MYRGREKKMKEREMRQRGREKQREEARTVRRKGETKVITAKALVRKRVESPLKCESGEKKGKKIQTRNWMQKRGIIEASESRRKVERKELEFFITPSEVRNN